MMPFLPPSPQSSTRGTQLASLLVTDVDMNERIAVKQKESIAKVSVVLQLGISAEKPLYDMYNALEGFQVYPGFSRLVILMEGIYAEMSGGERVLCLVGSTKIPDLGKNLSEPFDWLRPLAWNLSGAHSESRGAVFTPPLIHETRVKAFVRYPKQPGLKTRAVIGRFESMRDASESERFFDPVRITSQSGEIFELRVRQWGFQGSNLILVRIWEGASRGRFG